MTKDKKRKKSIKDHGECCETCGNEPTNQGQRDSCQFCNEETDYGEKCDNYREAKTIYSIDIKHVC